jgi:hypothetical protein
MKAQDRVKKIVVAAQFNADAPVSWLRKRTGIKEHSIYPALRTLRKNKVITPKVFFDVSALGLIQFETYVTIPCLDLQQKTALYEELYNCEQALWVA